jgi:glycosyltransferase involved in cell wall biosynthesis
MRLLSIASSYVVGLNRHLPHEMARAGQGRWEVTAVSPQYYSGRKDLRPIHFEPLPGEACHVIPVPLHLSAWVHVSYYGRQLQALLREPWDVVHCWQEPYTVACALVAWLTPPHVPLVFWTARGIAREYPPPFSWMERFCLRRCAGWLACGRTTVETLQRRGYGIRPHRVMPLGVALDAFRPDPAARARLRHDLGWDEGGPPVVGFLGRFVPEKGPLLLTKVLDELKTPWRALFVGAGPLELPLREWARGHGSRAIVVTGVVHDAVPSYLNAMDLLCAPSQTTGNSREQQGRMITEAWACGVPVLAGDCGEIPYVVGNAGIVVPEKLKPAWSAALADLLESPSQRAELAARGLARAREMYSWPVIARNHLAFFDELVAAHAGASSRRNGFSLLHQEGDREWG